MSQHYVPMSTELARDAALMAGFRTHLEDALGEMIERELFPWRFPDPNPMPEMVLFRWLARVFR